MTRIATTVVRADRSSAVVVPREVAQARIDARGEAERIVAHARARAEAIHAQARDEGYATGIEAGKAEVARTLIDLVAAHSRAISALEAQTRELALLAAQHLVSSELTLRPELITRTVQDLLERLRRARRVVVRAHPDDCATLSSWLQGREASHSEGTAPSIELRADDTLARGGCIVQTEIGTLDASVETRLAALQKALERR